jgi:hypothetical protein
MAAVIAVVALVAVALVAAAAGFAAGVLLRGRLLDALARAVEREQRRRRENYRGHRPREALRPGAMTFEPEADRLAEETRRAEERAAKASAFAAIQAERGL